MGAMIFERETVQRLARVGLESGEQRLRLLAGELNLLSYGRSFVLSVILQVPLEVNFKRDWVCSDFLDVNWRNGAECGTLSG